MSCMGCHLGAWSTKLRTECVIDVVQATSYLGTAVVFLYKASCKPNSEPKLFCCSLLDPCGIFRKDRQQKVSKTCWICRCKIDSFCCGLTIRICGCPFLNTFTTLYFCVHLTPLMISDNCNGSTALCSTSRWHMHG